MGHCFSESREDSLDGFMVANCYHNVTDNFAVIQKVRKMHLIYRCFTGQQHALFDGLLACDRAFLMSSPRLFDKNDTLSGMVIHQGIMSMDLRFADRQASRASSAKFNQTLRPKEHRDYWS